MVKYVYVPPPLMECSHQEGGISVILCPRIQPCEVFIHRYSPRFHDSRPTHRVRFRTWHKTYHVIKIYGERVSALSSGVDVFYFCSTRRVTSAQVYAGRSLPKRTMEGHTCMLLPCRMGYVGRLSLQHTAVEADVFLAPLDVCPTACRS